MNLAAVMRVHPGWQTMRLLDARLSQLVRGRDAEPAAHGPIPRQAILQAPPPLPPPPPPPDLGETVVKQAEMVAAQLSRGIEEKVRLRREELDARAQSAAAQQRRESERSLELKRSAIVNRYLLPVQNARLAVIAFNGRLKDQTQMTQAEIEQGQLRQEELSRLEQEMRRQLAEAGAEMEASAQQAKAKMQAENARALADYRAQLEQAARTQALQEGQATTSAMTEAMNRLRTAFGTRPAGPQVLDFSRLADSGRVAVPAPGLGAQVERLRMRQTAAWRELRDQVRAEVTMEGRRRGLAISFRQPGNSKLPDYTRQARGWLAAGSQASSDQKDGR